MYSYNGISKEVVSEMVKKITDWIKSLKMKGAVLGISGGKDSTTVAMLLIEALGSERVYGVLMPNGVQDDIDDSLSVVKNLGINYSIINMKKAYESLTNQIGLITKQSAINVAPRLRMTTLYAIGQTLGYRVCGTGNACEAYVGYCTKWGDTACDFNPIANYTVDEVIAIGLFLRKKYNISEKLINKTPSDGLCGKSDEDRLGVKYSEIADVYLGKSVPKCKEEKCDFKYSKIDILSVRSNRSEEEEKRIEKIRQMHASSKHKFEPIPTCPR